MIKIDLDRVPPVDRSNEATDATRKPREPYISASDKQRQRRQPSQESPEYPYRNSGVYDNEGSTKVDLGTNLDATV